MKMRRELARGTTPRLPTYSANDRLLGPNKPMVPTAPATLNRYLLPSRRRHIGQPLDSAVNTLDLE